MESNNKAHISGEHRKGSKRKISRQRYRNFSIPLRSLRRLPLARSTAGRFIFWGGFDGAERVIMLSVPDYIESDDPNEIFNYIPTNAR